MFNLRRKKDWKFPTSILSSNAGIAISHRLKCPSVLKDTNSNIGQSGRIVLGDENISPACISKLSETNTITGACKALYKYGVCQEKYWPLGFDKGLDGWKEDAETRKILAYYFLDFYETDAIKEILHDEILWISFDLHEDMLKIPKSGIVSKKGHAKSKKLGKHYAALIGYTNIGGELHWEIQNSLGVFWGNHGYAYIPHSLMKKIIHRKCYIVVTEDEKHHKYHNAYIKEKKEYETKGIFQKLWSKLSIF